MRSKRLLERIFRPHIAIALLLLPIAVALLVAVMLYEESSSVRSIAAYVLSAYTLTIWCVRIPDIIAFIKAQRRDNRLIRRYIEDPRFRIKLSLCGSLIFNAGYAAFQLFLGIYHESFWYYTFAGYYLLLAVMRFFLALHTLRYAPGERLPRELTIYRGCGLILLIMNLALAAMTFFMVYFGRTSMHHEITAIAMAAYTFTAFTLAIINIVKYRKYNSPVFSAAKAISLAAASVSLLTLESTMLTAFADSALGLYERRLMLGLTGGAVSVLVLLMAIYMLTRGTKRFKDEASRKDG